jgi:glycosyltransferase involved in cell wall biosynthesis
MRILFLVSGVYPHYMGGVSTWADLLVNSLPEFEFEIVSVVSNPHVELRYSLPDNVVGLHTIPLWGSERPEEYNGLNFANFVGKAYRTTERAITEKFQPHFKTFIEQVITSAPDPQALGRALYDMHVYFQKYDYKTSLQAESIWQTFIGIMKKHDLYKKMDHYEAVNTLRTLTRYLKVLAIPVPKTDLCHSAIASVAGLIGILAKFKYNTPNILTEHGVYYRERMLDLLNQPLSFSNKIFWLNFYRALAALNYHFADKIYPVCNFNSRWEQAFGIHQNKIHVVPNGVDCNVFRPGNGPLMNNNSKGPAEDQHDIPSSNNGGTVAAVIRIDRLKDALNLIMSMKYVKKHLPDVKCLIYGPSPDKDYAKLCVKVQKEAGLEDTVQFMGYTNEPELAYRAGDIIVMSSISEGFPFALIEAMATGKAIVATDVGGMAEALGDAGLMVPARAPRRLGAAIIKLFEDPDLRDELGRKARKRILKNFRKDLFISNYRQIYNSYNSHKKGSGVRNPSGNTTNTTNITKLK